MRLSVAAVALMICWWPLISAQSLVANSSDGSAPAPAPAAGAPDAGGAGRSSADDAAARHAKRTECLKQAKLKKLVGAQKTAFIKDCLASP
jgi:psiF repeat-containing protein